jgi:GntR family transcriptional repressor for pyruvate dehydrogenase complex
VNAGPTGAFTPLEQLRAHELVAEQLRRHIRLHLVPPGKSLPPERELARVFGVGRATVQQAIALLEAEELVWTRRGRAGGTFVAGAVGDEGPLAHVVDRVRRERDAIEEALVFRSEVEPAAAVCAARERTEDELAAIAAASAAATAAPDDAAFMANDTEFHLSLARAAHNRYYAEAIERLRLLLNDALVVLPDSELWHARSNREHAVILAALERRDERGVRSGMRTHVDHTDQSVRALLRTLASGA